MRFLLYSHDGLGLGHARRNLALARALTATAPDASVLLATSADGSDTLLLPPAADMLRLPGIRKSANGRYESRRLPMADAHIRSLRSRLLAAAVAGFRPDVLVADKHPVGVQGELRSALHELRASGGTAVLGLRDVLDEPRAVRREWESGGLWRDVIVHHPIVLVYGRRDVYDPLIGSGCPADVLRRVRYCGYVTMTASVAPRPADLPPRRSRRPQVLATAGGGGDGLPLLRAFVASSRWGQWDGIVVGGPQMPAADRAILAQEASQCGVTWRPEARELTRWFPHVDAVVSMGGYNTLVEALAAGTPVICVPRTTPRREQAIRAELFAGIGLVRMLAPDALSPERLRDEVSAALETQREELAARAHRLLGFDGAASAATALLEEAHAIRHHSRQQASTA